MQIPTNENYLRDFFEHAPIGFHVFGPDQTIIDVNESELQLLGYSREDIVNRKKWTDLIVPEHRQKFQRHWEDLHQYGRVTNLEYTVMCKDGTHINVLLNASARFDENGKLLNTRGSIVDITERKHMVQQLQQNQKVMRNNIRSLQKIIKGMEQEKNEWQQNIQVDIKKRIFPLIEKMKQRDGDLGKKVINTLEQYLGEMTGRLGTALYNEQWKLSTREIDICFLIQSGLTTKEISELLCSSKRTIDNHRNNIRKKLGISRKNVDLADYLKSL